MGDKPPRLWYKLADLREALEHGLKKSVLGVTQGGSSRKFAGAKPAATIGRSPATKPQSNARGA